MRSSRYAGEDAAYLDNVALLLREMDAVEEARRGARFLTVDARSFSARGSESPYCATAGAEAC